MKFNTRKLGKEIFVYVGNTCVLTTYEDIDILKRVGYCEKLEFLLQDETKDKTSDIGKVINYNALGDLTAYKPMLLNVDLLGKVNAMAIKHLLRRKDTFDEWVVVPEVYAFHEKEETIEELIKVFESLQKYPCLDDKLYSDFEYAKKYDLMHMEVDRIKRQIIKTYRENYIWFISEEGDDFLIDLVLRTQQIELDGESLVYELDMDALRDHPLYLEYRKVFINSSLSYFVVKHKELRYKMKARYGGLVKIGCQIKHINQWLSTPYIVVRHLVSEKEYEMYIDILTNIKKLEGFSQDYPF